jgi:uncharacterized tellurite resistance protein B-like protein
MKWSTLYGEWGKLLYAVANCDGSISEREKDAFKELINSELVDVQQKDEFGMPVPSYMYAAFDYLEEEIVDSSDALESFFLFIHRHKESLTDEMIAKLIKSAENLSAAYYGINQSEQNLLQELRQKLTKFRQQHHLTKTTSS